MNKKTKEDASIFFEVIEQTPDKNKRFVSKSLEIVEQIAILLRERKITQRALSKIVGKNETEISKWLSGSHNFTVRTLTAIESALQADIVVTPHSVRNNIHQYTSHIYRACSNRLGAIVHPSDNYTIKTKTEAPAKQAILKTAA